MNDFKRIGDKLLTIQNTGLFSGYIPIEIDTVKGSELTLNYTGGKIDSTTWNQIKSFLQWTYNNSGGEGQIRLFYNPTTCTWKAHPFEQFVSKGLTTDEKKDSDLSKKVIETMLSQGYVNNGTVHHHCVIGAFQSGTDYSDEIRQNGIHITLGFMDKDVYDYHSRATLRGVCYSIVDSEWIEDLILTKVDDTLFPPDWKNYVVEKPVVPVNVWANGFGEAYSWANYGFRDKKVVTSDIPSIVDTREADKKESVEDDFIYSIDPDVLEKYVGACFDERIYLVNDTDEIKNIMIRFVMELMAQRKFRMVDIDDIVSYIETALYLRDSIGLAMMDTLDEIVINTPVEMSATRVGGYIRNGLDNLNDSLFELEEQEFYKEDIQ